MSQGDLSFSNLNDLFLHGYPDPHPHPALTGYGVCNGNYDDNDDTDDDYNNDRTSSILLEGKLLATSNIQGRFLTTK